MKNIIAVIILYLFINNPFFAIFKGLSSLYVLLPILLFLGTKQVASFFRIHKNIAIAYTSILLFGVFRTMIGGSSGYLERLAIQYTSSLLMSSVIISMFYKYNISYLKISTWMVVIAVTISMLCYTVPEINHYVRYDLQVVRFDFLAEKDYRFYGLSDALTSAYGYVLATFFGFGLYKGYGKHRWFWLLSPFLAISIMINARTAILPLIVSILLNFTIHYEKGRIKQMIYIFVGLIVTFKLIGTSSQTSNWLNDFYLQMMDIITGSDVAEHDTYGALVDSIILPETLQQWIIGRGRSLFFHDTIFRSDMGFVNQLSYGGIIYMVLILTTFLVVVFKIKDLYFILFCISMMIIGNMKGNYLETSDGYRYLTFLIMAECYNKKMAKYHKK